MKTQQAYDRIAATGIVAGMRGHFPPEVALPLAETLLKHGISVFEFTMNSVQPVAAMQAVKQAFGDEVVAGMGTVLSAADAQNVLDAGADFVVSPAFQSDVVQTLLDADVLVAPGVATPSEAVAAWGMGVSLLKLFPIGALGLEYYKAMFGPLNHMQFMCNGAMNAENSAQFIKAGALAVGMGSWLTGDGTWTTQQLDARASTLTQAVRDARASRLARA